MLFCQNFYNQWHFFSQILQTHVFNKDTHVDHFWCLISKYTEYDCSKCLPALSMHVCSRLRKFWTALTTGFWGRSFQIISSLVLNSSVVDGLLVQLVIGFQHGTPYMIIKQIKSGEFGGHLWFAIMSLQWRVASLALHARCELERHPVERQNYRAWWVR